MALADSIARGEAAAFVINNSLNFMKVDPERTRVVCRDVLREIVAKEPELRDKLKIKEGLVVADGYPADKLLINQADMHLKLPEMIALFGRITDRLLANGPKAKQEGPAAPGFR